MGIWVYRAKKPEYAAARLGVVLLARFEAGLTWPQILEVDSALALPWWRCAIVDAEDRGLLWWDPIRKAWELTAEGRDLVRFCR